jgi:ribosomal protein L7/L12
MSAPFAFAEIRYKCNNALILKIMFWTIIITAAVIGLIAGIVQSNSHSEAVQKQGEQNAETFAKLENFNATKKINGVENSYIFAIDQNRKKVAFIKKHFKEVVPFEQIISVEILEDNTILHQKSSLRTIGGAVVGNVVAGGAGMIVGGLSGETKQNKKVSKVQVKVKLRNINHPSFTIDCFDCKTMTIEGKPIRPDSLQGNLYKQGLNDAQRIADTISVIIDATDREKKNTSGAAQKKALTGSVADELGKLAELKAKGILTDEEFNTQKQTVLGNGIQNDVKDAEPLEIESVFEDEVPQNVRDAVANGQKILAVKLYKDYAGCSLEEAKNFVDGIS